MEQYSIQVLYDIFQIPFVCWGAKESFQYPGEDIWQSPIVTDSSLRSSLEEICDTSQFPVIYLENELIFYGVFGTHEKQYCSFGPVARYSVTPMVFEEYKRSHHIKDMPPIRQIGLGLLTKLLAMVYFHCMGKQLEYADICIRSNDKYIEKWTSEEKMEDYWLSQSENDRQHGSGIAFENQLMEIVKNGDVEAMKEAMSGNIPDVDGIGEVSSDSHRQMEYMLIVSLTLITRAAVDGGMNPEEAYALGDVYLRQIEGCSHNTGVLTMLGIKAQIEFTEKVRAAKEQKSQFLYINKCKDYIAKNLRKDIKVSDIAPAIGISRTYLTHKFSELEGMTIQQYILKERCEHAANLLVYSDYSIALISEYFCFASQSHFGSSFKRFYGMTPKKYRLLHSRIINDDTYFE
ncbi:MAG: helix-turn-helix transcriptional regulator [Lachnospiraceae bacterium]|nr:helix-turn-helix transcriptional regulator [Lachnospiraceae bacterium]